MQTARFFRGSNARRRLLALAILLALSVISKGGRLQAQASPTASRAADLQVGVTYSGANPDYSPQRYYGIGGYVTLDLTHHYGVELNIRQLNTTGTNNLYERTYELGGRYVRHYGRFAPYGRVNIGRGVFNFPHNSANLAYNMYALGGGVDVNIIPSINVRGDFEYQSWPSFPPRGLSPLVATVGVAYHFH